MNKKCFTFISAILLAFNLFAGTASAGANEASIAAAPGDQTRPAIYNNKVVWEDNRNGNLDIYIYDLDSGIETPVCTNSGDQSKPSIYGSKIVWQDKRNGNWDIYMYDLSTLTEKPIYVGSGDQINPRIYGNIIAWQNGASVSIYDISTEGTTSVPSIDSGSYTFALYGDKMAYIYNDGSDVYSLYIYDITTRISTYLTEFNRTKQNISMYADRIVWTDWRNYDYTNSNFDIYMFDLQTNSEVQLTTAANVQDYPVVYGNFIVWHDKRNGSNYDLYSYDLVGGLETPGVIASGNQVYPAVSASRLVWADNRSGNYDIYVKDLTVAVSDTTPPEGTITVNGGASNTVSDKVTLNISAVDNESGISQMMISNESDFAGASWESYATVKQWTLTSGEGLKNIYIKLKDKANNVSAPYNASITFDKEPAIIAANPENGSTAAPINSDITVTFSESVFEGLDFGGVVLKTGNDTVPTTVTVSGSSMTIHPVSVLGYDTAYTLTIPSGAVRDTANNNLASTYTATFATEDITPPTVTGSDPVDGATGIVLTKSVKVSFSEDLVQGVNFSGISLKAGSTDIPAAFSVSGATLTVDPTNNLSFNTLYTLTIPSGAVEDTANNALSSNHTLTFTTLNSPPPVVSGTAPSNGATGVAVSKPLTIKFNVNLNRGPNFAGITLKEGSSPVSARVTVIGQSLIVSPSLPLDYNTAYTLTVPAGALQGAENCRPTAETTTVNFTTIPDASAPTVANANPGQNAANVQLNQNLTVVFNENVLQGSNFSGITLKAGTVAIPVTCSISGMTLIVDPIGNLSDDTRYTLTIPGGAVKDDAGNVLTLNYTTNFTTQDTTAPVVSMTYPINGASGIPVDKYLTMKFSENINRGSNFSGITLKTGSTPVPADVMIIGPALVVRPASILKYNTSYTLTVPAGAVQDAQNNSLVGEDIAVYFTTIADTIAPAVAGTAPVDNAVNVQVDKNITVTFSEEVVQGSNFGGITLTAGTTLIPVTCSVSGSSLTIDPKNNLSNNTVYTVTIPDGAVKDSAGNNLPSLYETTFATPDVSAPVVSGTYPINGAMGIPLDKCLWVKYNENLYRGPNFAGITLKAGSASVPVSVIIIGKTLIIRPASKLEYNTGYTLTVPAEAVQDAENNKVVGTSVNFRTV